MVSRRTDYDLASRLVALLMVCLPAPVVCGSEASPPSADELHFFESKIRPLLVERCYECHSVESGQSEGELLVDSAIGLRRGGSQGAALIPGKPQESLLLRAVGYRDTKLQMPPDGKLDDAEIEVLRQWIQLGAPDPRQAAEVTESSSPLDRDPSTHWAFRTPQQPKPASKSNPGSRDPIDDFAHAAAETRQLDVNGEASKETLIRRLYFDLTGLPPSKQAISEFVQSKRPDAYRRLVDSLLASPEFGERFGRHWLDVARYADTVGYALAGKERRYKGSQRFRDWTIRAFAADMPYDEMLRHQLAADRTDPNNQAGHLDAMGFLTLGRKYLNPLDTIDDRIDVITRGLLGMTVTCARCHDHKFDPIPSSDYYSLGGIIFSSEQPKDGPSPLMLVDKKNPVDSPVLVRGQIGNPGPIAARQFLTALRRDGEPRFSDGSGRWELAQRITASDNPLTARVMVNRLWGHLIGKPLVNTPSDFGFRTQPPEVPEVLDDLAADFSRHWSIKRIIRRIVMTRVYRQTAEASDEAITKDPDNQVLARANRKRRDFESLRDSVLCVAGSLDQSLGGPPVDITLETPSPRRTIYAMIDRQNLPALFRTFDFANPDAHSPQRYFTTVPGQALFLLNNRQMIQLARRTDQLVRREVGSDDTKRLAAALFRRILRRDATPEELSGANAFLQQPASTPEAVMDMRSLWSYGTASIDESQKVLEFTAFPVFQASRWQAADDYPTAPPYGYAFLDNESGHTPNRSDLAVVRRFTAPIAAQVRLRGQMGHRNDQGDGIRTSIWIGGKRQFLETQKKSNRPYGPILGQVAAGETIDFVASPGETDSFDTFFWRVTIQLSGPQGQVIETDSAKHFSGPYDRQSNQPLSRLAQLAQTLMMSNEFAFVD